MKTKSIIITIFLLVILMGLSGGAFIVQEKDQVVITQFGKPVGVAITEPGMYFKLPFIQVANYFEK